MEWVETTGKSIDEARSAALDELGVAADDAEFETVEEPKQGLFGRVRGQARVRARVRPTPVRPKQDRRRRGRDGRARRSAKEQATSSSAGSEGPITSESAGQPDQADGADDEDRSDTPASAGGRSSSKRRRGGRSRPNGAGATKQEDAVMTEQHDSNEGSAGASDDAPVGSNGSGVSPEEVGDAAVHFVEGLADAFGLESSAELAIDGTELEVSVTGDGLGLLVGPGGRTLNAIQDLARVASQRRLGDHETRLRVDVSGYRERREAALAKFAHDVAEQVRSSGTARSLEPMVSADRKIVHDVLNDEPGVSSRSEGDEPTRRIIVELA